MAEEKKFNPKEVATLILSKVGEILKKSELNKSVLKLQTDPQEHVKGVHTSFGEEGKSFAGANVRASQAATIEEKSKKFAEKAKKQNEEKLNELKTMPSPNLPKSEEIEKSENLEKAENEAEDRYYVDTKKRDKHGRVTIYDKKRDIEFKAKLKEESNMEKSDGFTWINPKLLSQDPTHTYKGAKVKSVKESKTKDGTRHVVEYMEGEHKGKWTQAHENDLQPIKKEEDPKEMAENDKKKLRLLGQLESEHVSPTPQGKRYFRSSRELKSFDHEHKGVGRVISGPLGAKKEHKWKLEEIKEQAAPKLPKSELQKEEDPKEMAESSLMTIHRKANILQRLMDEVSESKEVPAWVQHKLSSARTHMTDVMDYIGSKAGEGAHHEEEMDSVEKAETENSKKLGYKLSEAAKKEVLAEQDKAFEIKKEDSKSSDDARLSEQLSPEKNLKEQAEGNNELAGTTPTQVGEDGKNKPGFSEMRSDLKLAKWLGRMEEKRKVKKSEKIEKSENFDEELSKAEEFESLMKMAAIWEKRAHYPDLGHYAETKGLPFTFEHAKNMPKEKHLELEQKALKHAENAEKDGHHRNADYHKKKAAYHKLWTEAKQSPWHYEDREKDLKDTHDALHGFWKGKAKEKKSSKSSEIKPAKKTTNAETAKTKEAPVSTTTATSTVATPSETKEVDIPKTKSVKQSLKSGPLSKPLRLSEENEAPTLVKSAESSYGMHKVEYYTYQELHKFENLEKGLNKEKRLQDLKDAHFRVKNEKAKTGISELQHETKGVEVAQHQKGVHTKPGAYLSQTKKETKKESKVPLIAQHAESQRIMEESKQISPKLTRSENDSTIRSLQKAGLSPQQIWAKLKKEEECEKEGKRMMTEEEKNSEIRKMQKAGLNPQQIWAKLKKEESVPKELKSTIDLKSLKEKHKDKVAEWEKQGADSKDIDSMINLHDISERKKQG